MAGNLDMKLLLGLVVIRFSCLVVGSRPIGNHSRTRDQPLGDVLMEEAVHDVIKESPKSSITYDVTKETQQGNELRGDANRGGEDRLKHIRERDPVVLDVMATNDIVTDVLDTFKNRRKPARKWTKSTFTTALKELGIFTIKGLKIVTLTRTRTEKLKRKKGKKETVKARFPRRRTRNVLPKKGDERRAALHKRTSDDLCKEYVDSMFVLAHADSQTAYLVESVRCDGTCKSTTSNQVLGSCQLATKTMVVYIIDSYGRFAPKTIEPGCACECLPY